MVGSVLPNPEVTSRMTLTGAEAKFDGPAWRKPSGRVTELTHCHALTVAEDQLEHFPGSNQSGLGPLAPTPVFPVQLKPPAMEAHSAVIFQPRDSFNRCGGNEDCY